MRLRSRVLETMKDQNGLRGRIPLSAGSRREVAQELKSWLRSLVPLNVVSRTETNCAQRARGTAADRDTRLGRSVAGLWTLERVLGRGGTAIVYDAAHRNGQRAALKILHPELALQKPVVRRFLREGYAANRIKHPGAVRVIDDGEADGLVYIVLELLRGRSLSDRVAKEGPLPVRDVLRVAIQTLDVLAAAHDVGVVHRDVKPSNLFELDHGEVKVLDFGVARVSGSADLSVTSSGVTVGTPAFMAPEQAAGRLDDVDALTDVWSLGATMFWLLSGRLVHDAVCGNAAIVAAATREAPRIRALVPEVPDRIAAIVDRALAFDRGERWPNCRSMRRALSDAMPESAGTAQDHLLEVGDSLPTGRFSTRRAHPPYPDLRVSRALAIARATATRLYSLRRIPAGVMERVVRW